MHAGWYEPPDEQDPPATEACVDECVLEDDHDAPTDCMTPQDYADIAAEARYDAIKNGDFED